MSSEEAPAEAVAAALARLHAEAAAFPDIPLIRALYEDLLPVAPVPDALRAAMRTCLAEIGTGLAARPGIDLNGTYTLATGSLDKVITIRAALTIAKGNTLWMHFNAAKELNALNIAGQREALAPCIMHCTLALDQAPADNPAPYLRHMMARLTLAYAPREALRHAILALNGGEQDAINVIRAAARSLGLIPMEQHDLRITDLQAIEKACKLPASPNYRTIPAAAVTGITSHAVIAPAEIVLPAPVGDEFYYMFRNAGETMQVPPIQIHKLSEGILSVDLTHLGRTQFYVFDRDRVCVEDLSWGTQPFITESIEEVPGALAVIGDRFSGAMNVCHFLLDHLTRIELYDRIDETAKILLAEPHETYKNIIAHVGLDGRIHKAATKRFSIRADSLFISSNIVRDFRHPGHLGAPWAIDYLRRLFDVGTQRTTQARRIFISRADSKARQILNWDEVAPVLAARGFEVVTLGELTLAEQIEIFAQAESVAAVHGAGLTNILFSPPGLRVLEILPQMVASPAYWILCHAAGHEYHALVARDPEIPPPDHRTWTHQPQYNDRNVIIDAARLAASLDRMLPDDAASVRLAAMDF